jgi:glutaredoxin-related protein
MAEAVPHAAAGKIPLHESAAKKAESFHSDVVETVARLVAENDVVVVGMGWNPHVSRARKALDAAGIPYAYHEIGNYAGQWKPRLAVKIWSGWPTFPQVFVKQALLGGADEVQKALKSGELKALLD